MSVSQSVSQSISTTAEQPSGKVKDRVGVSRENLDETRISRLSRRSWRWGGVLLLIHPVHNSDEFEKNNDSEPKTALRAASFA